MKRCPASPLADWFYNRGWTTMFHLLYGFESGIPWHCVIEFCLRNLFRQDFLAVRAGCHKSTFGCTSEYVHCTICQWRYHGGLRESIQRAAQGRRIAANMRNETLLAIARNKTLGQRTTVRGRAMRRVPKWGEQ